MNLSQYILHTETQKVRLKLYIHTTPDYEVISKLGLSGNSLIYPYPNKSTRPEQQNKINSIMQYGDSW